MSQKSLFCLASSRSHADKIVYRLKNNGFHNKDISALCPDGSTSEERAAAELAKVQGTASNEGLDWIFGMAPLQIAGMGPHVAGSRFTRAFARAGAKSGITESLMGMGVPKSEAKSYEGKIKKGNFLISFHNEHPDEITRAQAILQHNGGQDIFTMDESMPVA
ncbi:MAG TPA: hypothetical protein VMZ27_08925 [Candidatus Saccharimonadales bacterium]|nr:hypothetical protein [Candidatus Saccharimonadales bacterium]